MRRDQPTTPFDVEADELTQQFWGAGKGWVPSAQPTVRRRAERSARSNEDTTGSLRVIREGFAAFRPQTSSNTGEITRQRQHGAPRRPTSEPSPDPRREATLGELAAGSSDVGGWYDDELLDDVDLGHSPTRSRSERHELEPEYDVPLTPVQPLVERLGLGAVDPLLVRAGMLVLAFVLLVPVMLSLRPDRDDSLPGDVVEVPQQIVVAGAAPSDDQQASSATPDETSIASPTAAPDSTRSTAPAVVMASEVTDPSAREVVPATTADAAAASSSTSDDDTAMVDVVAERIVPACPQTYTAAPGDSWYRIAEEAAVTPSDLLAENNATTDTVILPGDDICLPEGATMPSPPTTDAPSTIEPATTDPAPSTTEPPATAAPTTTVVPVANLSRSEVQELIRQTWPEDEVETALEIARRESNFVATADNGWCCVGVFQIYWSVHRSWLDELGITERSDLFDARKNVAAAHRMWTQSGWGPWGG
jgi:LysM repeat protein